METDLCLVCLKAPKLVAKNGQEACSDPTCVGAHGYSNVWSTGAAKAFGTTCNAVSPEQRAQFKSAFFAALRIYIRDGGEEIREALRGEVRKVLIPEEPKPLPKPEPAKLVKLEVNGKPREIRQTVVTHDDIVLMAWADPDPRESYSVTYTTRTGVTGELKPGQTMAVENGMRFAATVWRHPPWP